MSRHVIFNADDFGLSTGINRGIIAAHTRGVVTSASLMVTGAAVEEAVALGRRHPGLALGLHWDVWGEDGRPFAIDDPVQVRAEFRRQLEAFERLVGRPPTHIDSHQHAHREDAALPVIRALVEPLGVPLRGDGEVACVGGFYAQWEWRVTTLEYVGVGFLCRLLREEVGDGWTELSCHPGYRSPDYAGVYDGEREAELATLTDERVRRTLDDLGLELSSYRDWAAR